MENKMSRKEQFHNLPVGTTFEQNGVQYTKIDTIRVSCCTSFNAHLANDPEAKKFIVPVSEVEVND